MNFHVTTPEREPHSIQLNALPLWKPSLFPSAPDDFWSTSVDNKDRFFEKNEYDKFVINSPKAANRMMTAA